MNKDNVLDTFSKKLKVPEMIISFLFLATGIYLWVYSGDIGAWFYFKLIAVFASVPLAIIGFKRKKKALAVISIILIIYAYGVSETKSPYFKKEIKVIDMTGVEQEYLGKKVFETYCIGCHGPDGTLQLSGAKDITDSEMEMNDVINLIKNGKNTMPAYKNVLTDEQTKAVADYVVSLRNNYKDIE